LRDREVIILTIGRPRKFTSAAELEEIGMKYIKERLEHNQPVLITGLCLALDTYRDVLIDYESGKYDDDNNCFSNTVKRLKAYCENSAEERLYSNQPTGAIFALKNYGWKDKQDVEISGKDGGPLQIVLSKPLNTDVYGAGDS
jgi:hypothetical protein